MAFVGRRYSRNTHTYVYLIALNVNCINHVNSKGRYGQYQAKQIAEEMLSIVKQYLNKSENRVKKDILTFGVSAMEILGNIALKEGTEESVKQAVKHFEMALHLISTFSLNGHYDTSGIKNIMAVAKSRYEKVNPEEKLIHARELYENRVKKYGQEDINTIRSGIVLARSLKYTRHGIEAERLVKKLIAVSKRVHGPDHAITKRAELEGKLEILIVSDI